MTDPFPIQPLPGPIDAVIRLPGSKSITNRALLLAALAEGRSRIRGALFSDDTRLMESALKQLGVSVTGNEGAGEYAVEGSSGSVPAASADLFTGNAGTATRFLTAFAALGHGEYRIDGDKRMRERPIGDLLDALNQLGVAAKTEYENGCPPILIHTDGITGGSVGIRGDASSQFLSALLMIAPHCRDGLEIEIEGELFSRPYVELTLRMMEQWGVAAENWDFRRFHVRCGQRYTGRDYFVEPDASGASYFLAAAAVCGGRVRIPGIGADSLQGDARFVDILAQMGCCAEKTADYIEVRGSGTLRGVDVDMNAISDTVMTLAAIAPFADSPTTIRNVAHIRHKETDRIRAVATELGRIGVKVEEREDGLAIHPVKDILRAEIETYNDHRMAMSFAVTGLRAPGISIRNPACVSKTFPDFFERLRELYPE